MKVKKVSVIVLLSLAVWVFSIKPVFSQNSLIVKFKDNSEINTLFTSLKKLTFSNGNIVLDLTNNVKDQYSMSSVRKLVFNTTSQTDELSSDHQTLTLFPNPATEYIQLVNIPSGTHQVTIFRLDGVAIYAGTLSSDDNQIDISAFPEGFYVLRMNNNAIKFAKR